MGKRSRHLVQILTVVFATSVAASAVAEPWRQWGGPGRDFRVESGRLAASWPVAGPPVLWQAKLSEGYSGVLVEGDRVYTAVRRGQEEILLALDATTGKILWQVGDKAEPFESQVLDFGKGPNATPLLVGDTLFLVGFTGRLSAVHKVRGELMWRRDLVEEFGAKVHRFGYANAPLAHRDLVIVLVGGDEHGALGFDAASGEVRWRTSPFDTSYAAPTVINLGSEEQLVFMAPTEVVGVALEDGMVRWRHPHKNRYQTNCLSPLWNGEDLLFISSQADGGSMTLKLTAESAVEGTAEDAKVKVEEVVRSQELKIFYNNALLLGDHVYASSGNFLTAYNYRSGAVAWKKRGFLKLNLVAADGKVVGLDENGKLYLLRLSPEKLEVLASHQLLDKPSWTPPTLVGTRLYVRDQDQLMALELAASPPGDHPSMP